MGEHLEARRYFRGQRWMEAGPTVEIVVRALPPGVVRTVTTAEGTRIEEAQKWPKAWGRVDGWTLGAMGLVFAFLDGVTAPDWVPVVGASAAGAAFTVWRAFRG